MSPELVAAALDSPLSLSPLEVIRRRTRALHAQLELSIDLPAWLGSIAAYRSLLNRYLAIYRPFELAMGRYGLDARLGPAAADWRYRSKVTLLERDFLALGGEAELDQNSDRSSEESLFLSLEDMSCDLDRVLGSLYVVEGSSLGGQWIYREIEQRLGLSVDSGASFFYGDGENTGRLWKQFTGILNSRISEPESAADAACEMFSLFERGLARARQSGMER